MVDLETLGTTPDSVITVIGWCVFEEDPYHTEVIGHSGDIVVNPQDGFDLGLKADWSTIKWWMEQSEEARSMLGNPGTMQSLSSGIDRLSSYWNDFGCEHFWCKGLDFDLAILRTTFDRLGIEPPWPYNAGRDLRTLTDDAEFEKGGMPRLPVLKDHVASHDAIHQVNVVRRCKMRLAELREI